MSLAQPQSQSRLRVSWSSLVPPCRVAIRSAVSYTIEAFRLLAKNCLRVDIAARIELESCGRRSPASDGREKNRRYPCRVGFADIRPQKLQPSILQAIAKRVLIQDITHIESRARNG